jgi:hypothetical protein
LPAGVPAQPLQIPGALQIRTLSPYLRAGY